MRNTINMIGGRHWKSKRSFAVKVAKFRRRFPANEDRWHLINALAEYEDRFAVTLTWQRIAVKVGNWLITVIRERLVLKTYRQLIN